jgi:23S rRNA (uracil1939-C5)-methyltransferase
MGYAFQLSHKEARIRSLFAPYLTEGCLKPILRCDEPWSYRNKMEFSFSQNKADEQFLGLVIAGSKGHVMNLSECHLTSPWFVEVLKQVKRWWEKSGLRAYRLNGTGSLRTLVVRESKRGKGKLVMLTVSGNPDYALNRLHLNSFIAAVQATVEEKESLSVFLRIQQANRGSPTQFFEMHLAGPDHLLETLVIEYPKKREYTFKISPTSFFQPNTLQAEKLYTEALKMVMSQKKQVLDLYAGTATLGMAFASLAEKVTAIELNPHAVFDAEDNKKRNGVENLEVICGDVGKILEKQLQGRERVTYDLVILDPPRTGLDEVAMKSLVEINSQEILYVSCNPVTQAANLQQLSQAGYQLVQLQPVDQFPHTPHIETIALLKKTVFP